MSEQCSSTARIGPHHCGHRTRAVLSSDKHWHTVPEHRLALLESYDSSTAVSAVIGRSGVRVTVLGHCQALPYDPVTASVKELYQMWKFPEQCCQCLPVLSFTDLLCLKSLQWTHTLATRSPLSTLWDSVPNTGSSASGQKNLIFIFNFSNYVVVLQLLNLSLKQELDSF